MELLRRQDVSDRIYDDQSSAMWDSYGGNWTRRAVSGGYNNNTITSTATPGASFSFTFSGSQAWLCGGLSNTTSVNNEFVSYPSADYYMDDVYVGSQKPWRGDREFIVYYQTPYLGRGTHQINLTVTAASKTNLFIIDFIDVYSIPLASGPSSVPTSVSTSASTSVIETSLTTPSPAATSSSPPVAVTRTTPIGAIAGGVVGGIAFLVIAVWYFFRWRSHGRAYYYQNSSPEGILAGEAFLDHIEPFRGTATTPPPSSSLMPQLNQPGPSDTAGMIHGSDATQRRTGRGGIIVQNTQRRLQHDDSGTRFGETGEQGPNPLQPPLTEVPPSYTP